MNRSWALQAAAVAVLVGVMLMLLGGGGAVRRELPQNPTTYRPATEAELRERDRQLLEEEMDRLWQERQQR